MNICLHLDLNYIDSSESSEMDREYQNSFKKLLKVLYANKDFSLTLSIPGAVLEYYMEKFPEAVQILSDLVERGQVEMLGGGFFAPVLPLLFPPDRSLQLEKNTSLLRALIGKRPRGVSLFGNTFDSSLIQVLKSCGFEYLILDEKLLETKDSGPFVVSQYGKSIKVLASKKDVPPIPNESPEQWISRLPQNSSGNTVVQLGLENISAITEKKFLSELLSQESVAKLMTAGTMVKNSQSFKQVYIPSGMENIVKKEKSYRNFFNFLYDNPQSLHIYERMVYLNVLLSQSHGKDKMRKKAAQEKLLEAQRGTFFISLENGTPACQKSRQKAYRLLSEAEKSLRESGHFLEALTSYDYNGDGFNEYIYQAENFNAVISPKGGRICDLNIISNGSNYTDFYGEHENAFFVESLSEKIPSGALFDGAGLNFRDVVFSEKKFDGKRKEIFLESEKPYSALSLPVQLQKKIIASSTGFIVQYILKNLSPFQLKSYFSVSIDIAKTDFSSTNESQYDLELIQEGNRIKKGKDSLFLEKGVSMIQLSDEKGKTAMLFEPNEEAGLLAESLLSKNMPEEKSESIRFFWPVDLASGRAMEKTINFVIIPLKKNRK